jgi:hypothetical protein
VRIADTVRDDDLGGGIDGRLAIVRLHIPCRAFHNPTVTVGEVELGLVVRLAVLLRRVEMSSHHQKITFD